MDRQYSYGQIPEDVQAEIWRLRWRGTSIAKIARTVGRHRPAIHWFLVAHGGQRPRDHAGSDARLSLDDRVSIAEGVAAGLSCRALALKLGRSHTTISREITRNGGRAGYRATAAETATRARGRRPKPSKLARLPWLRAEVELRLTQRWSPEQIAGWLRRHHPHDPEMRVSHETIYRSLFEKRRRALARELNRHLRTGRAMRRPRVKLLPQRRGKIKNALSIHHRPADARGRTVPGHWEGDLLFGTATSAVITLVERATRYLVILRLPDGFRAVQVREALTEGVEVFPTMLRRSLTWDQGKEMAEHCQFTEATGIPVYFCTRSSPWQRGSNENTNGLLRQYLPRRRDFARLTEDEVGAIAAELNARPRETLGWMSPSEKLVEMMGWPSVPEGVPWGTLDQAVSTSSPETGAA